MDKDQQFQKFLEIKRLKGKVTCRDMWTNKDTAEVIVSIIVSTLVSLLTTLYFLK